jgi:hypothetical protein
VSGLLLGLQFADQYDSTIGAELSQVVTAIQNALEARDTNTVARFAVALQYRDQLPQVVADELDQLLAALQVAFSQNRFVKSRQELDITIGAGALSATGALNPTVQAAYTELRLLGSRTTGTDGSGCGRVTLTNGSTVTATRETAGGGVSTWIAHVEAIEYYPDVLAQAVQYTTVPISAATTGTQAITAVGLGNALSFLGYSEPGAGTDHSLMLVTVELNAGRTVLTARANGGTAVSGTAGVCIVDFKV